MRKIIFVSSNPGKIEEVSKHLKNFGIEVVGKVLELPEVSSDDQEKVAKEKSKHAARVVGKPVITEDTGLYFDAYKNFPGTHPKFIFESIGYEGIFKLLQGKVRKASFKTMVSYCEPGKEPKVFAGICKGTITSEAKGESHPRLPYDSIFIPDGDTRVFAEMTKEEKAKYSHRAKAIEKFAKWFNKN